MIAVDEAPTATSRLDYLEALGPKPPGEPPRWPGANAIRRGEAAEFPRVAENAALLIGRAQECYAGLKPGNGWQGWLVDQIALTTVRLDRLGRADRRMRDLAIARAEVAWDDDRAALIEGIGEGIARNPRLVANRLRSEPHGCDWLIARWGRLALAAGAEAEGGWTAERLTEAHDLLGTPLDARQAPPGATIALEGDRAVARPLRPVELARREIAALRKRKAEAIHLDAIERAMVEADLATEPTPELRKLGRHEGMLRGWLRWLVGQVRLDPPKRSASPRYYPELPEAQPQAEPEAAPGPQPPPEADADAEAPAEVDPEAEPDPDADRESSDDRPTLPRIASGTRKDPRALRDQARREARRRKRGTCRA